MVLPMMGLAFVVFAGGMVGGIVLYSLKSLRHLSPFAIVPIAAGIGAALLCWILAVGLERAFHSETAGGIGFFGGYALGGLSRCLAWISVRHIVLGSQQRLVLTNTRWSNQSLQPTASLAYYFSFQMTKTIQTVVQLDPARRS